MHIVHISEVEKLVRAIRDGNNPQMSADAFKLRNKWLQENKLGVLQLPANGRAILEGALRYL
ncbi:MAG TPA: hypothetical protein VJ987_02785 [Anaerolineales bacterium]|nr:hypothetical protein [Anaerolineales bacterium]